MLVTSLNKLYELNCTSLSAQHARLNRADKIKIACAFMTVNWSGLAKIAHACFLARADSHPARQNYFSYRRLTGGFMPCARQYDAT